MKVCDQYKSLERPASEIRGRIASSEGVTPWQEFNRDLCDNCYEKLLTQLGINPDKAGPESKA